MFREGTNSIYICYALICTARLFPTLIHFQVWRLTCNYYKYTILKLNVLLKSHCINTADGYANSDQ